MFMNLYVLVLLYLQQSYSVCYHLDPKSICFLFYFRMQENQVKKENKKVKERVAFKTQSEVEVLDDGFKWRKYGKKMVKNSPNPR